MDKLLQSKRLAEAQNSLSMVQYDPEHERIIRSLQAPSEICDEENESRVANRRFSDILPLRRPAAEDRVNLQVFEYNNQVNRGITYYDYRDCTSPRIASAASAPLPGKIDSYLGNTRYTVPLYSLNRKSPLGQFNSCAPYPSSDTPPSTSHLAVLSTPQQLTIKTTIDKAPFEMPRPRIPPPFSKTHPYHALPSHPPASTSVASSYLPREGSTPSLASLEIRDNSIRLVKPDLRLSPLSNLKDKDDNDVPGNATSCPAEKGKATTMYRSKRNAQRDQCNAEGYGSQFKTMDDHSRSHSQHKQSFDAPQDKDYSRDHSSGPLISKPYPSGGNDSGRSESMERGRTMQRCYEFIDTEDQAYPVLSRASEDAGDVGRESNVTTMTDLMQRCLESPPPKLPTRQNHQQQTQPKTKHRPPPLNLKDPVYVGMVKRANRYEVEHNAIESSKAERFSSSVYGGRVGDPLKLNPPQISHRNESHGVDALQQYNEWRKNSKPASTSSQGPTHITIPTVENDKFVADKRADENRLPITDYPIAQDTLVVGRVRSRTTLGIREDHDKEQRQRQFSDGSAYTPSEYSTTPFSYGSTAIHHSPQRNHQFSCGSGSKASRDDANINDVEIGTDMSSPIYTPLTPFIMKASGAPVGAERGAKTLIGEHGWLEDTAASASGAAKPKPKAAKAVGLMGSLKRKAREIVDSTSFKPTRNSRTSVVNPMNISLDAREQSLLYCELEYNLNNSLDAYFKGQLDAGRLEASKLSRTANAWAQRGRPRVIGFRYDLETQIDLIIAHTNNFRFYGTAQAEGPAAITGLLYAMKINARYMCIRTYCQPDSVIAKHILDAQNLLRMLGSPEHFERPLEEVAQFFKVAIDRRKAMAEAPPARRSSVRIISNNSGQRVRFRDEDGAPSRDLAEMPEAGKVRADVRDSHYGSTKSHQRGQSGSDAEAAESDGIIQRRARSHHR